MRDRPAVSLVGPTSTPQQLQNAQIVNFSYQCSSRLEPLASEYPEVVKSTIRSSVEVSDSEDTKF